MKRIALRMLFGDRGKFFSMVLALTFSSQMMTQVSATFVGAIARTVANIRDAGVAAIWVMDPGVHYLEDVRPLGSNQLYRVRSVAGVRWAVPYFKGSGKARLANGNYQTCLILGLDDATLAAGPPEMIEGRLEDLRRDAAVIVDSYGANGKIADELGRPLRVGDEMEMNEHRVVVAGICRVSRTFQSQPVVYTTFSRATALAAPERRPISFLLAQPQAGVDAAELCRRIRAATGLAAYTREEFMRMTIIYYLRHTGITINFLTAILITFIVGAVVAGQSFYSFTLDNLRHFGALKAMGAPDSLLATMMLLQSLVVAAISYGLGVGNASLFGFLTRRTEVSFLLPWPLLALSAGAVVVMVMASALFSMRRVMKVEPAEVFKG